MPTRPGLISRRAFARSTAQLLAAAGTASGLRAQIPGERPVRDDGVTVLNPRGRVPVGFIIDDSTALVNLNRIAMPQFDTAFAGANPSYHKPWREWPIEIPDSFVRKFAEWSTEEGVKGKYSMVPFPACVGRLDRMLPGWTQRELSDSLDLVRTAIMPNWDIHPEMITHTRVIDTRTGHPYPDHSLRFMENWDWTTGRSVDEIADYLAYGLRILKNAGLPCEGVTTPGGFGNKALPQLAQATLQSVRDVFGAEIPHYFRHLYAEGPQSVAPRVEYVSGLQSEDPRCVVSVIGCTGDWTGGWDCSEPTGVDAFITADLQSGRMVEVIERGEPGLMVAHWTGLYWNGQELGFKILQEVTRRLKARFDHLLWMKLSEVSRYWAAKELTQLRRSGNRVAIHAPFACPDFTVRLKGSDKGVPELQAGGSAVPLKEVRKALQLEPGTWVREGDATTVCFPLTRGTSALELKL
ncbi:MAG: hypothetical protein EOP85_01095 [Verrucomicrobiaceae bacterium]|nr:MAG: hypothetical protein EOP85_01095 [Verrucomicrobiaceae bacterium]